MAFLLFYIPEWTPQNCHHGRWIRRSLCHYNDPPASTGRSRHTHSPPSSALQSDSPAGNPLQPLINMFSPFRALEELFNCRPLWAGLIPKENILRESLSGKYITINTENGESG